MDSQPLSTYVTPCLSPLTPNSSEDSWRFELEAGREKEERGFEVGLAAPGPYFPGVSTLSFQSADNGDGSMGKDEGCCILKDGTAGMIEEIHSLGLERGTVHR